MSKPFKLWKTTIVIWSDYHPNGLSLTELAREAEVGDCYCSKQDIKMVADYESDRDWDGTEFFDNGEAEDGTED